MKKAKTMRDGFTLVELLISLLLITVTFLSFCKIIVFSLKEIKGSFEKSKVKRICDNEKDRLLSLKFLSKRLISGKKTFKRGNITFHLTVRNVDNTLKKISLTACFKGFLYRQNFFKSKLIREKKNE